MQPVMGKLSKVTLFAIAFNYFSVNSPIKQDPIVTVDTSINLQLQMNINTNQIGRTFQDRTHLFKIFPRPRTFIDDYFCFLKFL